MIILFIWTFFVLGIRGHHFMENCQVFSRLGIVLILKLLAGPARTWSLPCLGAYFNLLDRPELGAH